MKYLPWYLVAILTVALAVVLSWSIYKNAQQSKYGEVYSDTVTYVDTIKYKMPVPVDSVVLRYVYETIPNKQDSANSNSSSIQIVETTPDSTTISIPITQTEYKNKDYRAWVSGYNAKLDSIWVFPKQTTITQTYKSKQWRWGLGVQAGVTVLNNKVYPYVGLGISYNIVTW